MRRSGRVGCVLEIMLAILFALLHFAVAWRLSALWPGVLNLPLGDPYRLAFTVYWWPPFRLLDALISEAGAPRGGIANLTLMPLSWLTCFAYGWITSLALALPFRLLRRQKR